VAQPGSAPALGAGGRRFKSSRPDQRSLKPGGCSSMVELQPSKLAMGVRFPSPALCARQNEERLRAGADWEDNNLVFPTATGTTMRGTNLLGRHFKPLLRRAELPAIRLHDLRHTCGHDPACSGKASEVRAEAIGPRQHNHPPRHLKPRHRGDGWWTRGRQGRGPVRRSRLLLTPRLYTWRSSALKGTREGQHAPLRSRLERPR
jgi:hypothetical protein